MCCCCCCCHCYCYCLCYYCLLLLLLLLNKTKTNNKTQKNKIKYLFLKKTIIKAIEFFSWNVTHLYCTGYAFGSNRLLSCAFVMCWFVELNLIVNCSDRQKNSKKDSFWHILRWIYFIENLIVHMSRNMCNTLSRVHEVTFNRFF